MILNFYNFMFKLICFFNFMFILRIYSIFVIKIMLFIVAANIESIRIQGSESLPSPWIQIRGNGADPALNPLHWEIPYLPTELLFELK